VCSLPAIANGQVHAPDTNKLLFKPGDTLAIHCNTGFTTTNPNVTCQKDRAWAPIPTCVQVTCSVPNIENGYYTVNDNVTDEQQPYGTAMEANCNLYYALPDALERFCQQNGQWSGSDPICIKIICNDTRQILHEALNAHPMLGIGENGQVSYNDTHFVLQSGSVAATCLENGQLVWIQSPEFGKNIISPVFLNIKTCLTLLNLDLDTGIINHKRFNI